MAPLGTPRRLAGMMLLAPGVAECARGWLPSQTPHPPAPHRGERLALPHRATPAENVRRTRALDEPAAPTKSAAAHPLQSTTSTKGDEAWSRGNAAPGA